MSRKNPRGKAAKAELELPPLDPRWPTIYFLAGQTEADGLRWVAQAADGLADWTPATTIAGIKRAQEAVESLRQRYSYLESRRRKNALLPPEEQVDPKTLEGPDYPYSVILCSSEFRQATESRRKFADRLDLNFLLVRYVARNLPLTYAKLMVIRHLPRSTSVDTPVEWANAEKEWLTVFAEAMEAYKAAQGGEGRRTPQGDGKRGRLTGSGDTNPKADRKARRDWLRWLTAQHAKRNHTASFVQYVTAKGGDAKALEAAVERDRKREAARKTNHTPK